MKKLIVGLLVVILAFSLFGCGQNTEEATVTEDSATTESDVTTEEVEQTEETVEEPEFVLVYADINSPDHPKNVVAQKFMDEIEAKSNGRIVFERYFDSSLGSGREIAEGLMTGVVDMMSGGSGDISVYAPVVEILTNTPYLYQTPEHGERVLRATWPEIETLLLEADMKPLFPYYMGVRQLISKEQITTFEDFQNCQKRTLESPYFVGIFEAMGASPVSVAFSETYTALQTGVVEAAGGDVQSIYRMKWYEQAKYVLNYNLISVQAIMVMSEEAYNELPEDLQILVDEIAWGLVSWANSIAAEIEEETVSILEEEGVVFTDLSESELSKFQGSLSEYTADFASSLGEDVRALYDKMITIE